MTGWWGFLIVAVLVPLVINEAGDLGNWLATKVLRWGARRLRTPDKVERYTEEWLAELQCVPGKLVKLGYAIGIVVWSVPRLRWQFARQHKRRAAAIAQLSLDLPCRISANPDVWFGETPDELETAKAMCRPCPVLKQCLAGALARQEPWGVWGGEIFERGVVIRRRTT